MNKMNPAEATWNTASAHPGLQSLDILTIRIATGNDIEPHNGLPDMKTLMTEYQVSDQDDSPSVGTLLTAVTVASILGLARKTVHKLVRERKLACVQVTARERRFTHEQVQDYIHSQSTEVRVDTRAAPAVSSRPKKGGAKSIGVSGTDLRKEMRSWQ